MRAHNQSPRPAPITEQIGTLTVTETVKHQPRPGKMTLRIPVADGHPARWNDALIINGSTWYVGGAAPNAVEWYCPTPMTLTAGTVLPVVRRFAQGSSEADTWWVRRSTYLRIASRLEPHFPLTADLGDWTGELPPHLNPDWPHPDLRRSFLKGKQGGQLTLTFPKLSEGWQYGFANLVLTYRCRKGGRLLVHAPGTYTNLGIAELTATGRHWAQVRVTDAAWRAANPDEPVLALTVDSGEVELSSVVLEATAAL